MRGIMRNAEGRQNGGFVLVWALLLMVVLLILGVSGIGTSIYDSQMSVNDALHKQSFYQADGGANIAEGLVFQNAVCSITKGGFTNNFGASSKSVGTNIVVKSVTTAGIGRAFIDLKFFQNPMIIPAPTSPTVSDANRDAAFYPTVTALAATNDALPHTNFLYQESVIVNPGSGLNMVSGYSGLGAGSVGGGTSALYTINSQYMGTRNSQATVTVQWKVGMSIINSASVTDCFY